MNRRNAIIAATGAVAVVLFGSCVGLCSLANTVLPTVVYPESPSIARLKELRDAVWRHREEISPSTTPADLCMLSECVDGRGRICPIMIDWPEFEPDRIRCVIATDLRCVRPASGWYCILVVLDRAKDGSWNGRWRYVARLPSDEDWAGPETHPYAWGSLGD
ncbi:MAG: hypothetical protein AAGI53_01365 [Planctomycetota bacterium]